MLIELAIRDFVIVKALALPLTKGFNVLTGETGAGKSILIDALSLVLGERATGDVVRAGAERAEITALFAPTEDCKAWLREHDLQADEDLILRRVIDNQGKSRAYINGTSTTLTQMRELGERLIDIHGQHMHQSLVRAEVQRTLLDTQSGLQRDVEAIQRAWDVWQAASARLTAARSSAQELAEQQQRLSWQLQTLDDLAPVVGEWQQVCEDHARLSNGKELLTGTAQALAVLDDDEAGSQRTIDSALETIAALQKHDPKLADVAESLSSASAAISQARSDLGRYVSALELDPGLLAQVEQRMQALFEAARTYRCEPDELQALHETVRAKLSALTEAQDIDVLAAEEKAAEKTYRELAAQLTKGRTKGAKHLSSAVSARMQSLGMPGGQFKVLVEAGTPTSQGCDKITFLVAGHEGVEPGPLNRVASGGELSRICLALSVVASETARVPTLIFDEVDTGVSGAVAEMVGQLLRELGARCQVLCVTHLPQVAVCANQHHQVSKSKDDQGDVTSSIQTLTQEARIQAIAELLGGVEITKTTRDHAKELLKRWR
jgi:DNA repair protein RecN (Recombination protein N)